MTQIFGKNFVKITFLLKKLLLKVLRVDLAKFFLSDSIVWYFENFSPTIFSQKFRQSNVFTIELYCKLISRKFLKWGKINKITTLWIVNFSFFHRGAQQKVKIEKKKSWNNVFSTHEIAKELIWRNYFSVRQKFSFFYTVVE